MSDPYRLKIKIGQHEFEAEGDSDTVQKQFQSFRELIVSLPSPPEPNGRPNLEPINEPSRNAAANHPDRAMEQNGEELTTIMKVEGRIVSLTANPESLDDALLLILYGQKVLRSTDLSTGSEIIQGLAASGGFAVTRIDKALARLGRAGDVIVVGEHRAKRYRLTNSGLSKARQSANKLLATVA